MLNLPATKLVLIERLDENRYWVKAAGGQPIGFAVSDGEKWVSVLLRGDWVACNSLHTALRHLIAHADV